MGAVSQFALANDKRTARKINAILGTIFWDSDYFVTRIIGGLGIAISVREIDFALNGQLSFFHEESKTRGDGDDLAFIWLQRLDRDRVLISRDANGYGGLIEGFGPSIFNTDLQSG